MSLRLRLLLALGPLFVLGLLAADVGTYAALQSSLLSGVDDQLQSQSQQQAIEAFLEGRGFGPDQTGPQQVPSYTYAALYSPSQVLIAGHTFVPDTTASTARPVLPATIQQGRPFSVAGTGGVVTYRVYAGPAVDRSGNTLLIAFPLDQVTSTLNSLLILEAGIGGGITIIVLVATWLAVRRGLRPLERMGMTARSIAASDLSRRIAPSNERTEVGRLGLALNTMLTQLEGAFAEREASERRLRHFISDASHELRTPLTSMRGYAELLQRTPDMAQHDVQLAVRRIEGEARRMSVLVDDLLLLARLDQGRPLDRSPVDLIAMVDDACADARASDPGRPIEVQVDAPLSVTGDDLRLRQALANLVRNALVHTPAGSPVQIELLRQNGSAVIQVVDHGPGVAPAQRERIFERFHRADPELSRDQGGSGLGLSIAAAVVGAHGGRLSAGDTPGGGATFRIELPLDAFAIPQPGEPHPSAG